jgi:hypothetical protein
MGYKSLYQTGELWMSGKERGAIKHEKTPEMQLASIILTNRFIPQSGRLDIEVSISATVNLSAEEARRKVNRFVHREISYLMRGDPPSLVVADRVCWQVPITLAFPSYGPLGTIGSIDVDVETGELDISTARIAEIQHRAQELAALASPQTAPAG